MRFMTMALLGAGCLQASGEKGDADLNRMKEPAECGSVDDTSESGAWVQTGCLDDMCDGVQMEIQPVGAAGDWFVDGRLVAEKQCSLELPTLPSRTPVRVEVVVGKTVLAQVLMSTHLTGDEGGDGGGQADIIISGNGDDCLFWIVGLGGCVTYGPRILYTSQIHNGAAWSAPQQLDFLTAPRGPLSPRGYGDFFRWTPNDPYDPGHLSQDTPPSNAAGYEESVEHWFELQPLQLRTVDAAHSQTGFSQFVNSFYCTEQGTGKLGDGMP